MAPISIAKLRRLNSDSFYFTDLKALPMPPKVLLIPLPTPFTPLSTQPPTDLAPFPSPLAAPVNMPASADEQTALAITTSDNNAEIFFIPTPLKICHKILLSHVGQQDKMSISI